LKRRSTASLAAVCTAWRAVHRKPLSDLVGAADTASIDKPRIPEPTMNTRSFPTAARFPAIVWAAAMTLATLLCVVGLAEHSSRQVLIAQAVGADHGA
jgi:hypothetical protein